MATLVTKLSFVTRVAISGVWLTSHTGFLLTGELPLHLRK
jgi:hypothetical protein